MTNLAPRALSGNFAPGFYVKQFPERHAHRAGGGGRDEARSSGLACAKKLYDQVAAHGWDENGTQALYKLYTSS